MSRRRGLLAERQHRRVIVTLKTDDAFTGTLYAVDREALVLREAEALTIGGDQARAPVDGEVLVLLPDVAYVQVVPSGRVGLGASPSTGAALAPMTAGVA